MSLTNKLQLGVDRPVWEWSNLSPASIGGMASAVSDYANLFVSGTSAPRYAYFAISNTLYRYDTFSDSWDQVANIPNTITSVAALQHNPSHGFFGRAIGPGTGNNTIQIAALTGATLVGAKIIITGGAGAGQSATITAVSEPNVVAQGIVGTYTAGPPASIADLSTGSSVKNWKFNQWRDYAVRITNGTGSNQVRRILYNNVGTVVMGDNNYATLFPYYYAPLATAPVANASFYQIESNNVTTNTTWTIPLDNTSTFVIQTGGLWFATGQAGSPFYNLQYYDIASDLWYVRGSQSNIVPASVSLNDFVLEVAGEEEGTLTSTAGAISVASAPYNTRTLIDASQTMNNNQYANMMLRLTGGTGAGQTRNIIGNNGTTFILGRDWDVIPDSTTTYQVIGDSDKVWMCGGNISGLYQYSHQNDVATLGRQYDYGVARTFSATLCVGVQTVTVAAGGATTYLVNDVLTLVTGTGCTVKVLTVSGGAVLTVAILTPGSGYTPGTTYATTGGGGTGCTITVNSLVPAAPAIGLNSISALSAGLATFTISAAGSNYNINDLLTCVSIVSNVRVTAINSSGAVTAVNVEFPGLGVVPTTVYSWTNQTVKNSAASGLQLTASTVGTYGQASTNINHNFAIGDIVYIQGCDLATGIYYNGYKTITGMSSVSQFLFAATGTTLSAAAFNGLAQSTTVLVDCTKNWQTNELVGKILQTQTGGSGTTAQQRRIWSNTPTSITVQLAITSPTTGQTKYVIHDPKPFGTENTNKNIPNQYAWGIATSGSGTTLVDSNKSWIINQWNNHKVKILAGTGVNCVPNEIPISTNTATTLTLAFNPSYQTLAGPLICGTGADDASAGATSWSNPGNITAADATASTVALSNSISHYLDATNFNFNLPSTATVVGIKVDISKTSSAAATDHSIKIIQGGTISGTDQNASAALSTTGYRTDTYGSSSNLWGLTWTYSQINASNFGVAYNCNSAGTPTVSVDAIQITVYYTVAGTIDSTSVYSIMDNWGVASATGIATIGSIPAGGSGYAVGDILQVNTGTGGLVRVATLSGSAVASVTVLQAGGSYTVATQTTTALTGSGNNACTVAVATTTTAGSATTLNNDLYTNIGTQTWGVNFLDAKRVRFIAGSNPGTEASVTSNTATQLTYGSTNTADQHTVYSILGTPQRGTLNTSLERLYGTSTLTKGQYLFSIRGNATTAMDRYDIVNDFWDFLVQSPLTETYTSGTMSVYDGKDRIYFQKDSTGRIMYYDLTKNIIVPCGTIPYGMGAATVGNRMFMWGNSVLSGGSLEFIYVMRHGGTEMWRTLVFW